MPSGALRRTKLTHPKAENIARTGSSGLAEGSKLKNERIRTSGGRPERLEPATGSALVMLDCGHLTQTALGRSGAGPTWDLAAPVRTVGPAEVIPLGSHRQYTRWRRGEHRSVTGGGTETDI